MQESTFSSDLISADADDNTVIVHVDVPATVEAEIEEVDGVYQQNIHYVYEKAVKIIEVLFSYPHLNKQEIIP